MTKKSDFIDRAEAVIKSLTAAVDSFRKPPIKGANGIENDFFALSVSESGLACYRLSREIQKFAKEPTAPDTSA